tara:strand:+ start:276 stop:668 length:393 start_codon:yes stop_codon:yes gene_type:complete
MVVVWVNGCFDVLHRGHFELLEYAKSVGDYLVVGIDSDAKVRQDKGSCRPYNNEKDRKFALECLQAVDKVVIFNSAEELNTLISAILPDIMVIGSDWRGKKVVGQAHTKELKFFDRIGDYSTTNILRGIK